jgi:hypothetical protein
MTGAYLLALTGDVIMNTRVSACRDPGETRTDAAGRPGFFLPVCEVDAGTHRVTRVNLHPMRWSRASRATTGFPVRAAGPAAEAILDRVAELSAPYGTSVSAADGTGWVTTT